MTLRFHTLRPLVRRSSALPAALMIATLAAGAAPALAQSTGSPAKPPAAGRVTPMEGDFLVTGRTNLREQPSTKAPRVDLLDGGTRLRVTGKVADEPWYAVSVPGGKTGYVSVDQLKPVPSAPLTTPAQGGASGPAVSPLMLEKLDRLQATLDSIDQRLAATKDLEGLIEQEKSVAARAGALADGVLDRVGALQAELSTQLREQRDGIGRLRERIDSMESTVQPAVDWAKGVAGGVAGTAAPMADEAQGWVSSTVGRAYGWVTSWIPWWNSRPAKPPV